MIVNWRPWTIETTAITAATPMMMPRVVSTERILLARMAEKATRKFSVTTIAQRRSAGQGARRGLVGEHLAVAELDLTPGVLGDVGLVGDQEHGVAGLVQLVEEVHDLGRGGRVEVAGRLVGEEDRRVVDQRAGDGHALALAAGELVGLVVHALAEPDPLQGAARPFPALAARHAGVDQRQLDVLQRVGARQQVEGLEDEADLLVADGRELAVVEPLDLDARSAGSCPRSACRGSRGGSSASTCRCPTAP